MRTLKITIFTLCLISTVVFGQKTIMKLSFTGIENSQRVQLDRIDIRNLTKSCDTTLNWPDTALTLIPMGINELNSSSELLEIFPNIPNPMQGSTKIILSLLRDGIVTITISTITGVQLSSFSQELQSGYHSFKFISGSCGTYILTANYKSIWKSIRIISALSESNTGYSLEYKGTQDKLSSTKSTDMSGKFIFSAGDSLEFKGYYSTKTSIIQDVPSVNKSYIFNFTTYGIPCPETPTVTYEGQIYNTVQIGTQCWLRENLNVGTRINGGQNQSNNGIIEKWCYDDNESNCTIYGGLYKWNEMMQYVTNEGSQGICPTGLHIPTDNEWITITDFLGGLSVAGGKMKSTSGWYDNGNGTNSSGFTALPGGWRNNYNGVFSGIGGLGFFWSSTEEVVNYGLIREMLYYSSDVTYTYHEKYDGLSVRCIKD